jgi:SAM-dependent methyltransferase
VNTILHLGCGGGLHDFFFKQHFKVTGIDTSEEMLKNAKKLNPEVNYRSGDMRSIRLNEFFDAITAPDSIQYMRAEEDLSKTFHTAYSHLKPGGIFLVVIEETQGKFKQNKTTHSIHSKGDTEIVFIENSYDPNPLDTHFDVTFVYLVRKSGLLKIYTDSHLCGIFKIETWHRLLKDAGFKVIETKFEHSTFAKGEYLPLFVCTKPL